MTQEPKTFHIFPSAQTKNYHDSFLFQSIKDYERVPEKIRNLKKLATFSFNMKRILLEN